MRRFWGFSAFLIFLLGACVRPYPGDAPPVEVPPALEGGTGLPSEGASPLDSGSPPQGSLPPAPGTAGASPGAASIPPAAFPAPYAVVLVSEGSGLNLRAEPALDAPVLALLPYDARDLHFTGERAESGGVSWMELETPFGRGWASAAYLSQQVTPEIFCADAEVEALRAAFEAAVAAQDGEALAGLLSPFHGLTVQWTWWGPAVVFAPEEVPGIFGETVVRQWGRDNESGLPVEGTFGEVVAPSLQEVLAGETRRSCNALGAERYTWPYPNLPYVALSAAGGGAGLRSWALGIVWLDGHPYLSALVQYRD